MLPPLPPAPAAAVFDIDVISYITPSAAAADATLLMLMLLPAAAFRRLLFLIRHHVVAAACHIRFRHATPAAIALIARFIIDAAFRRRRFRCSADIMPRAAVADDVTFISPRRFSPLFADTIAAAAAAACRHAS